MWALQMPVTRLVAPGPLVPKHTPTSVRLPRARVAVGHVGGALLVAHQDVVHRGYSGSTSYSGMIAPPGRPKMTSTPSS